MMQYIVAVAVLGAILLLSAAMVTVRKSVTALKMKYYHNLMLRDFVEKTFGAIVNRCVVIVTRYLGKRT